MADIDEADVLITRKQNLVIESAPDKRVVWRFPQSSNSNKLISVDSSPGFELKGVALDGRGKADFLVLLFASCPGMKLHDIDLRNFKTYGVNSISCDGLPKQPVVLSDLRFTTSAAAQSGLCFGFINSSIQTVQNYVVESCNFSGPGRAIVATKPAEVKVRLSEGLKIEQAPSEKH